MMTRKPQMRGDVMLIARLRSVEVDGLSLDDAVELSATARLLVAEYGANDIPVPEWLKDVSVTLTGNISARQRDARLKRLKEIDAEEVSLRTRDERKGALATERAALAAKLGQV